jgi:hypothetical protein
MNILSNLKVEHYLPTTSNSPSVAAGLNLCQISIVNIVLELLNTDVRELINAAIIAASIRPFKPVTYRHIKPRLAFKS